MQENGMKKSSCEGVTIKHLLSRGFRDQLPEHLTGKGSIGKIAKLLKKIDWISVFDYEGEAAFRYRQLPWRPKQMQRQETDEKPSSVGVHVESSDSSNAGQVQEQIMKHVCC